MLIAFIIASLALAVLAQSGVSSLRSIQSAARYEEALARARSRLALALHGAPLVAGDHQGDDGGGYRWRVRIAPISSTAVRPLGITGPRRPSRISVVLYAVSVWVWWAGAGSEERGRGVVRLDTQQVGSVAQ